MSDELRERLEALLDRYGVDRAAAPALEALLDALERDPAAPTTVRDRERALDVHIADSLSGLEVDELRSAGRIADLGAGAGLPGLVLAAALPSAQVSLVESARRKCEFIARIAAAMGLGDPPPLQPGTPSGGSSARELGEAGAGSAGPSAGVSEGAAREAGAPEGAAREAGAADEALRWAGAGAGARVEVVPLRVEEWQAGHGRCDAVTARALASLPVLCEYAAPLLVDGGVLVCWKGRVSDAEAADAAAAAAQLGLSAPEIRPLKPYPEARDHTLWTFRKVGPTPSGFPRRPGIATKRPISATKQRNGMR